MNKRLRRVVSFILSMIMMFSSLNPVYAADDNTGTGGGTGSGTEVSQNASDEIGTGYKIQLVFLELDETTYKNKNTPEGKQAVIEAWNNAKTGFYDTSGGEFVVQRIGEPIYLTTDQIKSAQRAPTIGFKFGDFDYGLGTKKGSVTLTRNLYYSNGDGSDISVSPSDINSALSALKTKCQGEGSGMENFLTLDNSKLPILIGRDGSPYLQNQGDNELHEYLLKDRPADKKTDKNSEYIVNQNFVALVNYIATDGGDYLDDAIYFHEVADSAGNQIELAVPEDAVNIFDKGIYNGKYGEYRLIISPYWNVNSTYTGGRTALTLRDMAFIGEQEGTGEGSLVYTQGKYFKILARVARLVNNDMFDLEGVTVSEATCSSTVNVYDKLDANKGIGISIFTSSMADDGEGPDMTSGLYIGSISHVFMPGSLSSDNQNVTTASMEYIGGKGDQNATETAFERAAIQIAKALAGGSTDQYNNVFTNSALDQSVVLNGTIKLPGLSNSSKITNYSNTNGYAGVNQKELIEVIEEIIDEYTEEGTDDETINAVRNGIKSIMAEQLGIDFDNPSSGQIQMQDLNLLIYTLARYQLDGVEANEDGWNEPTGNSSANIWKKILAYQAMLENEKSSSTIAENATGNWTGPLSITEEDIEHYINGKKVIDSTILGDRYGEITKTYPETSAGADEAIKDGVLDNKEGGQLSGSSANWDKILSAGELENGLVRVPVAMGNTQLYIGAGESTQENVNVTKGMIPSATGDMLKSVAEEYISNKDNPGFRGVNLYAGIQSLWNPNVLWVNGLLNTSADLDDISVFDAGTALGTYLSENNKDMLFQSVVKGTSFNSVYGNIIQHIMTGLLYSSNFL